MSRSNPSSEQRNPSTRRYRLNAKQGEVKGYDKASKEKFVAKLPFTFMLLDELVTLDGYDARNKVGIYANEIRHTGIEPLTAKWSKGGTIATGLYRDIKSEVNARGGKYTASLYIAYPTEDKTYALGNLYLKGSGFSAWLKFKEANQADLYTKAIAIKSFVEETSGVGTYLVPVFTTMPVSGAAESAALALDHTLQQYLLGYFNRPHDDEADTDEDAQDAHAAADDGASDAIDADTIPFAWLLPLLLPLLALGTMVA